MLTLKKKSRVTPVNSRNGRRERKNGEAGIRRNHKAIIAACAGRSQDRGGVSGHHEVFQQGLQGKK